MSESREVPTPSDAVPGEAGAAATPQGEAGPARPAKTRLESLDVLRALVIMLVVLGHLAQHWNEQDGVARALCYAIMPFAMPLFALVSGMFAKPTLTSGDYRTLFTKLLLPMACLQPFYLALIQYGEGGAIHELLEPQWILWFLLSMVFWRMMLPLFLHFPVPVLIAVGLTLAAGYAFDIAYDLSISRTLYFFPFFLAGFLWRDRLLATVARARLLWIVVFVLVTAVVIFWGEHGLDLAAMWGGSSYEQASAWDRFPALGRLATLVLSALACLGFIAIVPRRSPWLARLGTRTLTIYVLHGFPLLVCLALLPEHIPTAILIPVLIVLAVAISWALSYLDGPFNRFFDWLAALLTRRNYYAMKERSKPLVT